MKKFKKFSTPKVKTAKKFTTRHWTDWYSSREWSKYRYRFLHHNPKCYACGQKSEVVDHVKPHKGDVSLFEETTNHIPLCNVCHNTITAKFDSKVTNSNADQKLQEKLEWIFKVRKLNGIAIRVKVIPSYR